MLPATLLVLSLLATGAAAGVAADADDATAPWVARALFAGAALALLAAVVAWRGRGRHSRWLAVAAAAGACLQVASGLFWTGPARPGAQQTPVAGAAGEELDVLARHAARLRVVSEQVLPLDHDGRLPVSVAFADAGRLAMSGVAWTYRMGWMGHDLSEREEDEFARPTPYLAAPAPVDTKTHQPAETLTVTAFLEHGSDALNRIQAGNGSIYLDVVFDYRDAETPAGKTRVTESCSYFYNTAEVHRCLSHNLLDTR